MELIRSVLFQFREAVERLPDDVAGVLVMLFAITLALAVHRWVRRLVRHFLALRYPYVFSLFSRMRGVTQLALIIIFISAALSVAPFSPAVTALLGRLMLIATIFLIGWSAITALNLGADLYLRRFNLEAADNLLARKHFTQVRVLLRTAYVLVLVVTVAAMLMTFGAVRQYGVSLFASAGVAGIVAGLAARPVLTNIFAGIQLAMTQPIRIDDAVIVENEWGVIEEITATYVVVRVWDWRRLVVPLSYFIEKPFQNWTREGSALIGSAFFYLDYSAPVDAIRSKLDEIVRESKNWNGQVVNLQVTDAKERTIELRAIMSANNAGQTFDLRCEVREKMIDFLKKTYPQALPRERVDMQVEDNDTRTVKSPSVARA
jgi:small-conductance mechanosensitive channel